MLVALINGHFDLAAYLLDKGANPNLLSNAGVSPLYAVLNVQWAPIAAYPQPRAYLQQSRGYLDMMKLLLDKGADPNARVRRKVWYSGYNFDQSGVDEAGATPFWRAAYAADVAAMKLLVVARRRSVAADHEVVFAPRPGGSGGRRRQVGPAAGRRSAARARRRCMRRRARATRWALRATRITSRRPACCRR